MIKTSLVVYNYLWKVWEHMMRIGIITWFQYENYGTKLQAIALQKYLRKFGHSVELIDFKLDDGKSEYNKHPKKSLKERLVNKLEWKIFFKQKEYYKESFERRSLKLKKIIERECNLSKQIKSEEDYVEIANSYDLLICGSDQIWNPSWFHPYYYASFREVKVPKLAYAPSIGVGSIPEIQLEMYKKALEGFEAIAVREGKAAILLSKVYNKDIHCVVDPTLLLNSSEWNEISGIDERCIKENYIFCYFLSDNINHWKAAKRIAKKMNKKLVIIPQRGLSYIQKGIIIRDAGVEEFLNLIRFADGVVTDSFHATVFSLIYNKVFFVFERHNPSEFNNQNSRIYSILDDMGVSDHLVSYNSSKIEIDGDADYGMINKIMNEKIVNSKNFLKFQLAKHWEKNANE